MRRLLVLVSTLACMCIGPPVLAQEGSRKVAAPASQAFRVPAIWEYSAPLISPEARSREQSISQKDPSIVCYRGNWHVFMTVKIGTRTAIEYCSFPRWEDANAARRTTLELTGSSHFCAPQVFFFTPQQKWYLIYQVGMPGLKKMWVAYSTTANVADPRSWTPARPVLDGAAEDPRPEGGLDYWIICDEKRAYLFFTSLNGKLWRAWTNLQEFPAGIGHVELALQGPFFEASHTYSLKGMQKYLTIVEEDGKRYYKAYLADTLDGRWTPIADTPEHPFAAWVNIRPASGVNPWTDNVSHGELIREGIDQTMSVDPANFRFVFQGMLERDKAGRKYGQYPWRIGMLTPVH